jgi:hypothetical protein
VADVRFPAFGGRYPMWVPRRVVSDELLVSAFKLGNPVQLFVLMEANDLSRLAFQLALRLHAMLSDWIVYYRRFRWCTLGTILVHGIDCVPDSD